MTATTEPRGGFDYGWDPGEDGWGPNMNANLLRLSRFGFHASVLSMTTTTPPGSPTSGAGYIIPAGATGAWAGKTGQAAVWDGSAWAYAVPRDGWTIHVVNVGLVVYEDGAWSQSNLATASGVGAEPYAGAPAQTSFWRSTAAGVRAWVQLVAADITDLATTLAAYLTKANPVFTGILSGPRASLTEFGVLRERTSNSAHGALYPTGVAPGASNYAMLIYDDGTIAALQASSSVSLAIGAATKLTATNSAVNVGASTALQMNGVEVIDPSRNGIFAGLTASGIFKAQTAVDASHFQWTPAANERPSFFGSPSSANDGSGYHSIIVHSNDSEATGRNLGYLKFGQKVSGKSGDGPGIKVTINAETWGLGGSVGGFGGRLVFAAREDNASALTNIASFDTTKVTIATGIPLYQGATERITAGGDGRFASLRASGLAASSTYLTRLDANGELVASPIKVTPGVGVVFEQAASLQAGGGTWGGSTYTSWTPSAIVPIADDSAGNAMASLGTGYIWNSQRMNALTITDGASATPYRGRIKADRWVAYSTQIIQNTTSATSWFAGGSGDGSPTIPANYLKQGRRVRAEGRIFCPSCAADTAPEISLKVGSTTLWTRSKAFTIAAGNEIFIDVRANIFIDDENRLIVVGDVDFYAFATGNYTFKQGGQIDPYNGIVANTIDMTIKPSSTSEIWVRSFAFIEI